MRYLIVGFGNIGHKRKTILGNKCVATVDIKKNVNPDYLNSKDVPLDIFDAAVLTVPQQVKFELTEFFLSKNKHVLVEKPLIITLKQFQHLTKLSRKNKVIWFTSFNHRFEPNILKLEKLLKKKIIGKIYFAKFVYSFGNIKERIGTWRETQFGVLEEIAPHIIDFAFNFFGYKGEDFETLIARKIESNIFDHWVFATKNKKITFEVSSITWKYVFTLDVYGKLGSLHIDGLRKWGGSKLILRTRIFPSGPPKEKVFLDSGEDVTWKRDFLYFEKLISSKTTRPTDLEMSKALANISLSVPYSRKDSQVKLYEKILS